MSQTLRRRVYELVDAPPSVDGRRIQFDWFDRLLAALILLNVAAVMAETVEPFARRYGAALYWFEVLSVGVFTGEYVLRVWSCTAQGDSRRWRSSCGARTGCR